MRTSRKRRRVSSGSPAPPAADQDNSVSRSQKEADVWDSFCEEYVESVEQLPLSIHRNFALLKEIDAQFNSMGSALLPRMKGYIRLRKAVLDPAADEDGILSENAGHLNSGKLLSDISMQINELYYSAQEKMFLAQATYDAVDRHVRLLDQAISEHEMQLKNDLSVATDGLDNSAISARSNSQTRAEKILRPRVSSRPRKMQNTRSVTAANMPSGDVNGGDQSITQAKAGDVPIDPNEPRYCYCGQVSWGKMIACDAPGCEREWFHLTCVGLSEAPRKGKWYCDICKENNYAGMRKRV